MASTSRANLQVRPEALRRPHKRPPHLLVPVEAERARHVEERGIRGAQRAAEWLQGVHLLGDPCELDGRKAARLHVAIGRGVIQTPLSITILFVILHTKCT